MSADAYKVLWGDDESTPSSARPPKLSRGRIVSAAVALADTEGMAKVSMPRIAEQLGSGVMSLYRHVPGKRELVALMYDAALGEPPRLPLDEGWRAGLHAWAHGVRDFFVAHPWALGLATTDHVMGPNEVAWLDRALGCLETTRISAGQRMGAVMAVNGFVRGGMLPLQSGEDPQWFQFLADPRARQRFPHVAGLIAEGPLEESLLADPFEFGLRRMLDGLENHFGQ